MTQINIMNDFTCKICQNFRSEPKTIKHEEKSLLYIKNQKKYKLYAQDTTFMQKDAILRLKV